MAHCLRLGLILFASAALSGCTRAADTQTTSDPPTPTAPPLESPAAVGDSDSGAGETFRAKFETSQGDFVVEFNRRWSPHGVDHIRELLESGFYDGCRFFRVLDDFMAQFGINGDPAVQAKWGDKNIDDDPVIESNKRGYVTFAKTGAPNSRSTQLFINFSDNSRLDPDGFSPIGKVIAGMEVVDSIYSGYQQRPDQTQIRLRGNEYLNKEFPKLDYIKKATILKPKP